MPALQSHRVARITASKASQTESPSKRDESHTIPYDSKFSSRSATSPLSLNTWGRVSVIRPRRVTSGPRPWRSACHCSRDPVELRRSTACRLAGAMGRADGEHAVAQTKAILHVSARALDILVLAPQQANNAASWRRIGMWPQTMHGSVHHRNLARHHPASAMCDTKATHTSDFTTQSLPCACAQRLQPL